jgi:hypothetical protein
MPVAHQKRCMSLDTHFRGDSMNENKLFGESVSERSCLFSGSGKLAGRS